MSGSNVNWLPHLENMVPQKASGNNLSMYSIALEGWRRGLKLKFFTALHDGNFEIQFSLENNNRYHQFEVSKGDKVEEIAVEICKDKFKCKELLREAGVPVPTGKCFKITESDETLISFANEIGYPVVLKPNDGKLGRNVFTGIKTESELIRALQILRNQKNLHEIIIEKYIEGDDYRIYVIENRAVAVTRRVPANIVGNGIHTVEELINMKNENRKKNPNLRTRLIKVDDEVIANLKKNHYSLETIVADGERVNLRSKCNISSGGDPIDCTNSFPEKLKKIAVKAVNTIPGLLQSGVDMIVDRNNNGYIIEMNTRPGIGSHLFPETGNAVDVPKAIIDYYFPETINNERLNLYFNFNKIHDILRRGLQKEIVIAQVTASNMIKKQYEVYGDVQTGRFHNWLQKHTLNLKLNGYAKRLKNDATLIVVYGEKANLEKFSKLITKSVPQMQNNHTEQQFDLPLKVGFEIIN